MAKAVTIILILINRFDNNERYSNFTEPNAEPPKFWSWFILPLGTSDISKILNMPKA